MSGEKCPRACSGCRSGRRPSAPHRDLRTAFADKRCVVAPARGLNAQISLSDVNPNKTLCSCISDDHAGRQAGRHSGSTSACVPHCLSFMWPGRKNQSADYKLCRSMCSRVREAQCFLFGSGSG